MRLTQLQQLAEQGFNALKEKQYPIAKQVVLSLYKQVPKLHPQERPVVWSMAKLLSAMLSLEVDQTKAVNVQGDLRKPVEVAYEFAQEAIVEAEKLGQPWPPAYSFLALICSRMGKADEAIAAAKRSVEMRPDFWQGWNNLGDAYIAGGDYGRAWDAFSEGAKHKPLDPSLCFNRGLILLARGDYAKGLEWYERRWLIPEYVRDHGREFHRTHRPWGGEWLQGKTILLHAEQGHGDVLQQLAYIPWVRSKSPGRIILEVHQGLVRFCETRIKGVEVFALGSPIPEFDVYCPMMSLCYLHGTRPGNVPHLSLRRAA